MAVVNILTGTAGCTMHLIPFRRFCGPVRTVQSAVNVYNCSSIIVQATTLDLSFELHSTLRLGRRALVNLRCIQLCRRLLVPCRHCGHRSPPAGVPAGDSRHLLELTRCVHALPVGMADNNMTGISVCK